MPETIVGLSEVVNALPARQRQCFHNLFEVIPGTGVLRVPPEMSAWVAARFGAVAKVEHQRTIRVINRWTFEESLFNGLREDRPMLSEPVDLEAEIASSVGDAFCHAEQQTPEDVFGRVRGRTVVTGSNIAKYEAWSAVIVFDEHNPLHITAGGVEDTFSTAMAWCQRVREVDPGACFPFVLWNCLWPAGASVVHGHAQVALARQRHYARVERWRLAGRQYREAFQRPYFEDFFDAHRAIGLGFESANVRVLAHLTPLKENEIVLLGSALSSELSHAVYLALVALTQHLGARSFSLALYHPPLDSPSPDWSEFPVVVRLLERRHPGVRTSDIGALELFAASAVSSDPFVLAGALRDAFTQGASA